MEYSSSYLLGAALGRLIIRLDPQEKAELADYLRHPDRPFATVEAVRSFVRALCRVILTMHDLGPDDQLCEDIGQVFSFLKNLTEDYYLPRVCLDGFEHTYVPRTPLAGAPSHPD